MAEWSGFNPAFDDTEWDEAWSLVPIALVPPGEHPSGYRVERGVLVEAMIFDRPYRLSVPFDARLLYDPDGRLWMSNTPQEHIMMCNNGRLSRGHVLIGGMGLGVYPQYAMPGGVGAATEFTVLEYSPVVRDIVLPTLEAVLTVPMDVYMGDIAAFLAEPVSVQYDTIFLDTWDILDAAILPEVNHLRNLAMRHLAPGGRVLLWGYGWMVRLFEDACRQVLSLPPDQREAALIVQGSDSPAVPLLAPVVEHFADDPVVNLNEALVWCLEYVFHVT